MIAVSEICLRKILIKLKMPKEKRKRNNLLKSLIFIKLILINSIFGISDGAIKLNIMCKDLFTCTVKNRCVQLDSLQSSFENATIGKNLYNELDKNIDYGCIFTSGCMEECNKCPLCMTSKQQLVDVLSGNRRANDGECAILVNCAGECVKESNQDLTKISYCLRQQKIFLNF
uniref:Uncharacterized protein n=1 Tax=Meloidogyne enterolobii TaxID=390850 RepID=A0A6V7U3U9_MELEN|nr:unnamed protein product [Meloidogyne enterolobii]